MTTVCCLLNRPTPFVGSRLARGLARNRLPVHPASPILLTKNGPLGALDSVARLNKAAARVLLYLKFENRSRALRPGASNHWLYPIELARELRLSKGNFGGNRLLDGSISLSPLYPSRTNDLHVGIGCGPPREFPAASPRSGIVHHLSGPDGMLTLEPFSEDQGRSAVHPSGGSHQSASLRLTGLLAVDSHTCRTPWSVFQDGSNGEPTGRRRSARMREARRGGARAACHNRGDGVPRAYREPGFGRPPPPTAPVHARVDRRTGSSPFHIRPGRIAGPHPLPSRQFQALFDSLFKVLFIFPSRGRGRSGGAQEGVGESNARRATARDDESWVTTTTCRDVVDVDPHFRPAASSRRTGGRCRRDTAASRMAGAACAAARCVTPVTPGGRALGLMAFGRNLRSKTRWFTGLRNSHQVSHFATFFIDARARYPLREFNGLLATSRARTARVAAIRTFHRIIQSVGATGGVYKGRGRSQRGDDSRLLGIPR
ncbi:hypothetical protein RND71_019079 [Anisodus tanguticus]|uniref:Uncharacterized protein n=1 Tax=Anisodus tanguticus TaxID=243964 RepID=A0AAE1V944_9SOLA|nr:hypothetical protein RND71_019079 [Anisodus tanguticus]